MKIGLIAGGGSLPHNVISGAKSLDYEISIAAIKGFAQADDFTEPGETYRIGEIGKIIKAFKKAKCSHICFAGLVGRPNFSQVKPDFKGLIKLPGVLRAAKAGDDSLLSHILQIFEDEGFSIVAPQALCAHLLLGEGHLGDARLTDVHRDDALKACKIAADIGALDIGQGAVVCEGLVLAVEAQEGTDAMLLRVAQLPESLRGHPQKRKGVLAKILKPGQDNRVDLPTIGPDTVENAARAGLAGIVAEAGQAFILDKEIVIAKANAAGLFVVGLPPKTL